MGHVRRASRMRGPNLSPVLLAGRDTVKEMEMDKTSSRAEGARTHHHSVKARAGSFLLNCLALRGKEKPRSSLPIGVSYVEGPRRGSSKHVRIRASHNRRPLSTALPQEGLPPWSSLFVGVSVSTPPVAKSSTFASTATADRFAVPRSVGITTGGINAMKPTSVTKTRAKAGWLITSVNEPTIDVSAWLEPIF